MSKARHIARLRIAVAADAEPKSRKVPSRLAQKKMPDALRCGRGSIRRLTAMAASALTSESIACTGRPQTHAFAWTTLNFQNATLQGRKRSFRRQYNDTVIAFADGTAT